jgi:arsenate reductase
MLKLELYFFVGCPGHEPLRDMVQNILTDLDIAAELQEIDVGAMNQALPPEFKGSPTLLIDGRDIEDRIDALDGLGCRLYQGQPLPQRWLVEAALLRALKPQKILFLCVQNSARSQLAEAIARHLAPPGVEVLSAGSQPAFVRPQAIQVLQEAGIATTGLFAKSVREIETGSVEAVITLCAEEVCPAFPGRVRRLHWGLADPAKAEPEETKLAAFRACRDELLQRLKVLLNTTIPG